jgi:hypothetical protein
MTSRLQRSLGAVVLLWAGASAAASAEEANRRWTDPPASRAPADETVTYPAAASQPAPTPAVSTPSDAAALEQTPLEPATAATANVPVGAPAKEAPAAEAGSSKPVQPAGSAEPEGARASKKLSASESAGARKIQAAKRNAVERKLSATLPAKSSMPKPATRVQSSRSAQDVVATGALPQGAMVERRSADVRPGYRRLRSVKDALDAGLTVMTVRTYQLPDGRQIEIETEPDPQTRLDVIVRPY